MDARVSMKDLDWEWVELILTAREWGITPDEVRLFIAQQLSCTQETHK